ncbi:tetratricopeptide repeat protein [Deminuibacter soli]|uniref:Tetratricopeptide repeat protein n=1 Tax=Deminuibacter soli TaxID=2291815 RepID=A0A3E1NH20_9BACT|nr:hypothetical protein [Deminuibacter soli]RFM27161.1 hypothetical protein DXN05_17020 [Deminuibacter soli]
MRKYVLLGSMLLLLFTASAQQDVTRDSLTSRLQTAGNLTEKINAEGDLSDFWFLHNIAISDSFAITAIAQAEQSRSHLLTVNAYLNSAARYLNNVNRLDNVHHGLDDIAHALAVAQDTTSEILQSRVYLLRSEFYRRSGMPDKAIADGNQVLTLLAETPHADSLKIEACNGLGITYVYKRDMLTAFRHLLAGLSLAEQSNDDALLRIVYYRMGDFYQNLRNYPKAREYTFRMVDIDQRRNKPMLVFDDYMKIAGLYSNEKELSLGKLYFDKAAALADSLHHAESKIYVYLGLLNMYYASQLFEQGAAYLNKPEVRKFIIDAGMSNELDKANGYIFLLKHNYDSSLYYMRKVEPFFNSNATDYQRVDYFNHYAELYKQMGNLDAAIQYKQRALQCANATHDLQSVADITSDLDSLYYKKGDYKTAGMYMGQYYSYRDSLNTLSKEKDLLTMEIDNENKRKEREAIRHEQEEQRKHNIQYIGITISIVCVFTLLLMMGIFKVPAAVVRALGFFSFIFLFEFITLLADNQIHAITHGEPIKVLLVKIVLVAMLLPLHHWMEEKVIHYLVHHRLLQLPSALRKHLHKNSHDEPAIPNEQKA